MVDYREFPILYVDDEPDNLRIFELTFRRDFDILTAQTGDEGLRLLHENPIAVVITSYSIHYTKLYEGHLRAWRVVGLPVQAWD